MTSEQLFSIAPTAPTKDSDTYSDIAMTGLFNAYVSTINSERQVIWHRYNIMLIANSIIFGFLVRAGTGVPPFRDTVFGVIVGWVLCFVWWRMFSDGIDLFGRWNKNAARFSWPEVERERNPYVISEAWRGNTKGRGIYWGALATICLFALGYAVLGAYAIFT